MENILSRNGLTSSEANHITNIVKELAKDLSLERFPLTTSKVYKENTNDLPLDENSRRETWVEDIQRTGELFALSAWLKTAVKYKENLLNQVELQRFVPNVETVELEAIPRTPNTEFEDYLNQLNTKQRNEYLTAEAKASHIGKFVHQFDRIRQESEEFTPTSFIRLNGGIETVTVTSRRLYSKDELIEGFFTLQKEHREAEKVVNLYKSRHKEWQKKMLQEHNSNIRSIQSRNTDKQIEQNRKIESARLDFEDAKKEEKKEISALRIVIPNDLQETLDYVNQYAKK